MSIRLPDPPQTLDVQTREYLNALVQAIELSLNTQAMTKNKYQNTGTLTKRYTVDQSAATLAELRDYVCTLVDELRSGGNIG